MKILTVFLIKILNTADHDLLICLHVSRISADYVLLGVHYMLYLSLMNFDLFVRIFSNSLHVLISLYIVLVVLSIEIIVISR